MPVQQNEKISNQDTAQAEGTKASPVIALPQRILFYHLIYLFKTECGGLKPLAIK